MRNLRHTCQKNRTSEKELATLFEFADGDWFEDAPSLFESPYITPPWYENDSMFVRINGRRIPIRAA